MNKEIFKEVPKEDLAEVLQALKEDWPKHFILVQIINVTKEYADAKSDWEFTLYVYGDHNSGVYLHKTFMKVPCMYWFHVYTKNDNLTSLETCLKETQIIPWNKHVSFNIEHSRFRDAIAAAFSSKGLKCVVSANTMFYFPVGKELCIKPLPDDVYIDVLKGCHADEMNENWPHKYPGSEEIHRENLIKNFGIGIFCKSDNKMLSSALSNHSGGIFVLHSDSSFRGKGYARIIVEHMIKELRARRRIPFATVINGNTPSERLFKSIGFEEFSQCDYIFCNLYLKN